MKVRLIFATCSALALAGCSTSQPTAQNNLSGNSEAAETTAANDAPPPGDPSKNPDVTGFAKEIDTNKDGRMSRAEWNAKGLPESAFNMFEKGRGYVTVEDYQRNAAPPGVDLNGDGKLTVAELREFDRRSSSQKAK